MHHLYWKFWGVDCQCSNSGCHVYWEDFSNWFSIFFLKLFSVHDQIIHSKEIEREFIRCFKFNNTSLSSIGLFKENSGFGLCCMPRHSYMLYHFLIIMEHQLTYAQEHCHNVGIEFLILLGSMWNICLCMHILSGFSFRFCWFLCWRPACMYAQELRHYVGIQFLLGSLFHLLAKRTEHLKCLESSCRNLRFLLSSLP